IRGEAQALRRTAAQAAGIFVQARPDLVRRGLRLRDLLEELAGLLPRKASGVITSVSHRGGSLGGLIDQGPSSSVDEWESVYHAIVSIEKALKILPGACDSILDGPTGGNVEVGPSWEALLYPHAWIRLAAARAWGIYFSKRSPDTFNRWLLGRIVLQSLFSFSYPLCLMLTHLCNLDPVPAGKTFQVDPALMDQSVKNLVFLGQAMHLNPDICFTEGGDMEDDEGKEDKERREETQSKDDDSLDGALDNREEAITEANGNRSPCVESGGSVKGGADPLKWVFNRMAHMVVNKGEARRRAVFSWFFAIASVLEPKVSKTYLELMLLPLRRAVLDAEAGDNGGEQSSAELANEVMEILEEKVGSAFYLETLTKVNMDIARKRTERKRQRAIEKATDPVSAAERRRVRN
ncbi:unnamed protein product, partial [Discosporangium mesarthrocarpum]